MVFEKDLTVAANSSAAFDLVVSLPISSDSGNTTVNVSVTGPGFGNSRSQYFAYIYTNNSGSRCPFTVIGTDVLGAVGAGPLETAYKDRAEVFYGSVVDTASLPSDWRAYSGVALLILKDTEWLGVNSAQRSAICDYISQGGHLNLYTSENPESRMPELRLPSPDGKPGDYGFGRITLEFTQNFPPDTAPIGDGDRP